MNINKLRLLKVLVLCLITQYSLLTTARSAFKEGSWAARPAAMGGAFTAVSDDVNAVIYNPGGLALLEKPEVGFMYSKLFASLDGVNMGVKNAALALPAGGNRTFGAAWRSFASENEYQEDAFYVSYAGRVFGKTTAGLSVKYLGHSYVLDSRSRSDTVFEAGSSKYQATFDAGIITKINVKSIYEVLNIGLSGRNLTQPDVGLKTEDRVPAEICLGVAYNIENRVISALDISYRAQNWGKESDRLTIRIGEERNFFERLLAVRYGANSAEGTAGFGFRPKISGMEIEIDYAFIYPFELTDSQGSHHMSIILRFAGKSEKGF